MSRCPVSAPTKGNVESRGRGRVRLAGPEEPRRVMPTGRSNGLGWFVRSHEDVLSSPGVRRSCESRGWCVAFFSHERAHSPRRPRPAVTGVTIEMSPSRGAKIFRTARWKKREDRRVSGFLGDSTEIHSRRLCRRLEYLSIPFSAVLLFLTRRAPSTDRSGERAVKLSLPEAHCVSRLILAGRTPRWTDAGCWAVFSPADA